MFTAISIKPFEFTYQNAVPGSTDEKVTADAICLPRTDKAAPAGTASARRPVIALP